MAPAAGAEARVFFGGGNSTVFFGLTNSPIWMVSFKLEARPNERDFRELVEIWFPSFVWNFLWLP